MVWVGGTCIYSDALLTIGRDESQSCHLFDADVIRVFDGSRVAATTIALTHVDLCFAVVT